jgi:nicotinate-nucleotide adenylyltransferase
MNTRLGIFGGTFDPIHVGHLIVSEMARSVLSLDRVVFVPARIPPHKGSGPADPEHRLRMTDLACRDNPAFEVSDLELRRDGPSYTVETLRDLRTRSPEDTELYLLMGADSARDLESWKDHRVLLEESTVVVLTRAGVRRSDLPERVARRATLLSTPVIEISSSDIRRRVREGGSIRYLVPDPVEKYVRSERLYVS